MNNERTLPKDTQAGRETSAVIVFADIVGCSQISDALGLPEYARFIHEFHDTAKLAAELVFRAHHIARTWSTSFRSAETRPA